MKAIFKVGDHIVPKFYYKGIEYGIVQKVDEKNYYLKILCGTAILPISAQVNYQLENKD